MSYQKAVDEYLKQFSNDDETPLFSFLCSLFVSRQKIGNGVIQILKHKKTKICRILMRKNQTHEILLNHYITLNLFLSPIEIRWITTDYANSQPVEKDIIIQFPKENDLETKFRSAFNEARLIADETINNDRHTTIHKMLELIINDLNKNPENETYDHCILSGLKFYMSYDDFFKLPFSSVERILKKNNSTQFNDYEVKRIIVLAKREYQEKADGIEKIECLAAPFAYKDKLIEDCQSILDKNCEITFKGLGECDMKGKITFSGECSVFIVKNPSNYEMVFVSTKDKKIIERHVMEKTHHVFPNYPEWTSNDITFNIKFDLYKVDVLNDFYEAQYKGKYNIR